MAKLTQNGLEMAGKWFLNISDLGMSMTGNGLENDV
jgi:hypothetical protein